MSPIVIGALIYIGLLSVHRLANHTSTLPQEKLTFTLYISICMKKVCKDTMVFNLFRVTTLLYDPSSIHHNNHITLR